MSLFATEAKTMAAIAAASARALSKKTTTKTR
jgi:hypothetical protein